MTHINDLTEREIREQIERMDNILDQMWWDFGFSVAFMVFGMFLALQDGWFETVAGAVAFICALLHQQRSEVYRKKITPKIESTRPDDPGLGVM